MDIVALKMSIIVLVALAAGCASVPTGPSVMVLPGSRKSFEQFQADDAICRNWATQQTGVSPQEVAEEETVRGASVGAVLGAGIGAVIGAASGRPGAGAAIGAASGLMLGSAEGAGAGQRSSRVAQQWYDNAYQQCMYAKGNQVPGTMAPRARRIRSVPPPPPDYFAPSVPMTPSYDPPYPVR